MVKVKIYAELNHEHGLPVYAKPGDSGMDIRANHNVVLQPKACRKAMSFRFVHVQACR